MVHGVSGPDNRIAVAATGRNADDPAGAMGEPVVLKRATADGGGRWGDYYDIALDPTDGRTFWAVGEHLESSGWATWIGAFAIGPRCAADFSGDGRLDSGDLILFLDAWSTRDPRADFDRDGWVGTPDIVAYLGAWLAGCP
jgi:hypothetical protein